MRLVFLLLAVWILALNRRTILPTGTSLPPKPPRATIFRTCSSFNATGQAREAHAHQVAARAVGSAQSGRGRRDRRTDPRGTPNR